MFTCRALKTERRFSAQLWQVATVIGLATKYRIGWVLPPWSSSTCFEHLAPQTALPLHIDAVLTPENVDRPDPSCLDDRHVVDVRGDFEREAILQHGDAVVRHHFEPRRSLVRGVSERYAGLLSHNRTCVVAAPFHAGASSADRVRQRRAFCEAALANLRDVTGFAVMSDDPAWWDARLQGVPVVHLPRHEVAQNFVLGMLCADVVAVDSALGWWLARLNRREDGRAFLLDSSTDIADPHAGSSNGG